MDSVELFAGAGGLALGTSRAGFNHLAVIEWDSNACSTLRLNQGHIDQMKHWNIHQCDVRQFDYGSVPQDIHLLAGGVPCQPFSIGGKHKGHKDERNLFPELVHAIRKLQPKAVLVENVKGLRRPSFAKYFAYIELMLTYPELRRGTSETWMEHLSKLERYHTGARIRGLTYKVLSRVVNAADFGVPQKRERLFIVAIRSDVPANWSFPEPSHSHDSLLWQQYITGEYWERHAVPKNKRPKPTVQQWTRLQNLRTLLLPPLLQPWRTVRDSISDLPEPARSRSTDEPAQTHFLVPGARSYAGHTGSPLDEPAKTLKAGVHGVPGGENMLLKPDGTVRYFTIRESARLQSFPDEYTFGSSWTESMRQIGNAVPVSLSEHIARKLRSTLQTLRN